MTVSMRVMSAEKGVDYLLRTVITGDGDRSLGTPLTRYYTEAGTPPGTWIGGGLSQLADGLIRPGDEVTEIQLRRLLGQGRDPMTGDQLGVAFQKFRSVAERIKARVDSLPAELGPASRAEAVEAITVEEQRRGSRSAVAGYDYTFSLPKSASVLWGVADSGLQSLIVDAHHQAISEVLDFMEREVAATRIGATGVDGAVAQVDTFGLAATAYDHYDSRASDPHLHTHVVVSNKVKTVLDQRWRALDGRPMHAATVALSELHEAVVADHLTRLLGVGWESRDRGRNHNPVWAITGVPDSLMAEFSIRARHIDAATDQLIDAYLATHGRGPSAATIMKLRAQATLTTRPPKQVRSLADLTAEWRTRAQNVLGQEAADWVRATLIDGDAPPVLRADDMPLELVEEIGGTVMEAVGEKRATWHRWNLAAEASRQLMGFRFQSMRDREAITGLVVDAAERASLRLTPGELASSPALFQRTDGTSVFRPKHAALFSSTALLDAEARLLERAHQLSGPTVPLDVIETTTRHPDSAGHRLGPDQAQALTTVALSGRVLDLLVGPAGTGKTTAMRALRQAWEKTHGPGSVVGLAPSAVAAEVLADDLGIAAENTAKWWTNHLLHGENFRAGQLVIVDEASLAGTISLDRITGLAADAGAKVLLVGDYSQLQAVEAAGAFGLLAHDRSDVPTLTEIRRFTHRWEKTASLQLRLGETATIDTYIAHDRIIGGETEGMIETAYRGWQADRSAGRATILVTDSGESMTALNVRARTDRILADEVFPVDGAVRLRDGTDASPGDTVITRHNDRRIRNGRRWIRNGDRWTISAVRADGSVTIRPAEHRWGGSIVLPADYVSEHLDLGYAITSFRAQGVTVDTAHVLVDPAMTRENLYVAMTRGRDQNLAYVVTDTPDDTHEHPHEITDPEEAARRVLFGVLNHVGAELSAHETIEAEQERWASIRQLAAEYETIAAEAQQERWVTLVRGSGLTREQGEAVIDSDAFTALSAELRRAEANHYDIAALLPKLVRARAFTDADDIASVLHWRVATATTRPTIIRVSVRSPKLIAGLILVALNVTDPEMRQALGERHRLITERATTLADHAVADKAPWTQELGAKPSVGWRANAWIQHVRTVAAYRDLHGISSDDALGASPSGAAQKIDHARAQQAIQHARTLAVPVETTEQIGNDPVEQRAARSL